MQPSHPGALRTFAVGSLGIALVLAGCGSRGPAVPDGVFFPRLTGAAPQYPAALIEGTLVENDGCLELTDLYVSAEFSSSPGKVVLPLWPEGSKASRTGDGHLRVEAPGLPTTTTSQRLDVGGMFTPSLADAEQMIGRSIPSVCQVGVYWVATPVHS